METIQVIDQACLQQADRKHTHITDSTVVLSAQPFWPDAKKLKDGVTVFQLSPHSSVQQWPEINTYFWLLFQAYFDLI